jgi:chromosome segregation ATPase
VDGVRKDVELLKDSVRAIGGTQELAIQAAKAKSAELEEALRLMRADLERAKAQAGKTEEQVRNLTATCDGLTDKLTQAKKQLAETSRQAARMTDATGTIRLHNTDFRPVEIRVNDRVRLLQPNETVVLESQPLGTHEYEVFALNERHRFTLTADRPFEIEVYNRAVGPVKTPPRQR